MILQMTPPSRPMGIKIQDYYPESGWCVPKITWNHNLEPDMVFSRDTAKHYRIYRATTPDMRSVPSDYIQIAEVSIPVDSIPSYVDYETLRWDCAALDQIPPFGTKYPVRYKVKAVDIYQDSSVFSDFVSTEAISKEGGIEQMCCSKTNNNNIPKEFALKQNYPNPFNPITKISFDLPKDELVTIKIYDILGREIKTLINEFKNAGNYMVTFNASEFASGIYFYRIKAGSFVQTKRMVLIK